MNALTYPKITGACWRPTLTILGVCLLLVPGAITSFAQTAAPMPAQAPNATADAASQSSEADQIAELRAEIAKLQVAQQTGGHKKSTTKSGMKMGTPTSAGTVMIDDKDEMGMAPGRKAMPSRSMGMKDNGGEMEGMPPGDRMPAGKAPEMRMEEGEMGSMPPAPADAMGMCCMGKKSGMSGGGQAGMSGASSAMPGQPGASHLYHIGSNGFFLNHPQHITLTSDQRMTLNRLKEKAMLDRATTQRRMEQGEQELYALTGADQPDASKMQAKVDEIEKMRADERMSTIRAVGEASNVLTPEQRQALTGTMAAGKR